MLRGILPKVAKRGSITQSAAAGVDLAPPARKTIDLEGRIVKDGVRKAVKDRQLALEELVKAIAEFRKFSDQPLTLRGGDYARAVQALNSRARDSSKHNCTHCVACRHMCFTLLLSSIIDCSQRLIQ
jgi:hypothetical protein